VIATLDRPAAQMSHQNAAATEPQRVLVPVTTKVGVVAPAGFHSRWLDQSAPAALPGGQTTTLTVRFRNTGSASWVRGITGQQANLGVVGDGGLLASGWPTPDRAAAQSEAVVPPDSIATFSFAVRAPTTAATYRLDVRPVIDGTTWMEDEGVYVALTSKGVVAPGGVFAPVLSLPLPLSTVLFVILIVPLLGLALYLAGSSARARRPRFPASLTSR
jgi:hypothetical protein